MANVSHASLTGSHLHEPKGIETATAGQAYLASGAGTGAWTTISGLSLTGAIAPWLTPIAPSGWYELNGATISSSSDAALYNVMTIQQNGNRISGAATISGLSSVTTANFKVGYFVFGTGIAAGTTILSIDSPTDITMSANASSSGTSSVVVSPWQLVSGGIVLPDMTTAGRYLRSRSSSIRMGQTQTSQNKAHTHGFTTAAGGSWSGNTGTESVSHFHSISGIASPSGVITQGTLANSSGNQYVGGVSVNTSNENATHFHGVDIPTHIHTGTTDTDGSSEVRPETLVVMWCVKR